MNLRLFMALLIAKVVMYLSVLTGRGRGSSLPGMLALRIYPDLLKHFQGQSRKGVIMITGTNGKTTTSNMLDDMLEYSGYKVVTNREGANLITGVTTAFVKSSTLTGRVYCDYAVLEVDEAAFPLVTKCVKPNFVVITNFFRDQLDRYGELDMTIKNVLMAIQKLSQGTRLILNADDPLVARLARESQCCSAEFYGIRPVSELSGSASYSREAKFCPFCGKELIYNIYLYSQLGDYKCLKCGFARPQPDIEAISVHGDAKGTTATIQNENVKWDIYLPVRGLYNLYNALAAFSTSVSLGIKPDDVVESLKMYIPATGRMEMFHYGAKMVTLTLVKNPTGFNQALANLRTVGAGQDVMIAINDNDADGRDISWLWDVDFEVLAHRKENLNKFISSGQRAEEMVLRLKYAGVPVEQIKLEKDFSQAIDTALNGEGTSVSIWATYTALWPVEKLLRQRAERVHQSGTNRRSSIS